MPNECPNCEKIFRGPRCRGCGFEPGAVRANAGDDPQCAWMTNGRRCLMAGEFSFQWGKPRTCGWHSAPRHAGAREMTAFEAFEPWVMIQRRHYCNQWAHSSTPALWDALQGQQPLTRERTPCEGADCKHREMLLPSQVLHPKMGRADVGAVIHSLVSRFTAPVVWDKLPALKERTDA